MTQELSPYEVYEFNYKIALIGNREDKKQIEKEKLKNRKRK